MWTATVATAILSTRTVLPAWFSLGLGNALVLLAVASSWAGFVAFSGQRTSWRLVAIGAVTWLACYFGIDAIRYDINHRIILISVICSVYAALVAQSAWRGWKDEPLPSFMATTVLFGLHAVTYLLRIPLSLIYPATEDHGNIHAPWFGVVAMEAFTLTIFSCFVFMALIKERAERRYRLAAEVDSLTLVSTRRHFASEARAVLDRKPDEAFLAVLDLDYFKKINDTYGHIAGDRVLQSFAQQVLSKLRPGMRVGRLGGEEFGLLITQSSEAEARDFIEDLRAGVEALEIRFNGNVLKVTTSIGIAGSEEAGLNFDHLMAGADNALYLAKENGRNRVNRFQPAMRLREIIEDGQESRVSLSGRRVSRILVRSRPGRQ